MVLLNLESLSWGWVSRCFRLCEDKFGFIVFDNSGCSWYDSRADGLKNISLTGFLDLSVISSCSLASFSS